MCGIVGYFGSKNCVPVLINGLRRLEYRGYDSAGIAVMIEPDDICLIKKAGKVDELANDETVNKLNGFLGIGHTRWATHGEPNDVNAHPHFDAENNIIIVHNGIIENYKEIKEKLIEEGYKFKSDTDTEVLSNLINFHFHKINNFVEAVRIALAEVEGTYGIACLCKQEPDKMVVARKGSPLLIGVGKNETLVASDAAAVIHHTKNVVYLEDRDMAVITKNGFSLKTIDDVEIIRENKELDFLLDDVEKTGYDHFMLKEICEQTETIQNTYRGRINADTGAVRLGGLTPIKEKLFNTKRIIITACGTAWHAGIVGEYMLEQYCRIPTEVEYASEFRYRRPVINDSDIVIAISQSGETLDTLEAIREAKKLGASTMGIVNVIGSTIAREVDAGTYIHAGPEIGVASTKAFTSQLMALALMTIMIAEKKGTISKTSMKAITDELKQLPKKIQKMIDRREEYRKISLEFKDAKNFLYLGRGINFPVALEGALKLKEISYIHAEGYPAAEMKHGPIALIDENMPVVFIAPKDRTYEKIISNIQEVKARKGVIIALASEGDKKINEYSEFVLRVPKTLAIFAPIINVIPLQFLAYYIAVARGCNVDQPRNLAKSVTVE